MIGGRKREFYLLLPPHSSHCSGEFHGKGGRKTQNRVMLPPVCLKSGQNIAESGQTQAPRHLIGGRKREFYLLLPPHRSHCRGEFHGKGGRKTQNQVSLPPVLVKSDQTIAESGQTQAPRHLIGGRKREFYLLLPPHCSHCRGEFHGKGGSKTQNRVKLPPVCLKSGQNIAESG